MTIWQQASAQDAWVVGVQGRLAQEQSMALENVLRDLLDQQRSRLVVDLSQTSYINSGGLRTLVTAWRMARQQGGNLVLCGLNEHVREIFLMVGFDKVFQIFPTLEKATIAWEEKP